MSTDTRLGRFGRWFGTLVLVKEMVCLIQLIENTQHLPKHTIQQSQNEESSFVTDAHTHNSHTTNSVEDFVASMNELT